jgi:hypothetical protein
MENNWRGLCDDHLFSHRHAPSTHYFPCEALTCFSPLPVVSGCSYYVAAGLTTVRMCVTVLFHQTSILVPIPRTCLRVRLRALPPSIWQVEVAGRGSALSVARIMLCVLSLSP